MAKYTTGQVMPDFTYCTPFAENKSFSETVAGCNGKTALVFLRYYGCPICQLDLHTFADTHKQITQNGGQLLVVLQSDPKGLAEQITPETFPYDIVCDPEMKLYEMLSIEPAASMAKMMSFKALKKVIKSTKAGYKHGAYEGNEQQLPATFVMNSDRTLTYVRYGKDAGDVPTPEELAELLK